MIRGGRLKEKGKGRRRRSLRKGHCKRVSFMKEEKDE
jgi:hypothetical protein